MFHIKLIIFWHVFSLCFELMVSANFCSSCCSCNKAVTTSCYHCNHLNGCQAHAHTRQLLGCIPTLLPLQPFKWLPDPHQAAVGLYTHVVTSPTLYMVARPTPSSCCGCIPTLLPLQPFKWLPGPHTRQLLWLYTHYPRCFLCNHLNGWQAHTRQLLWLIPRQPFRWLQGPYIKQLLWLLPLQPFKWLPVPHTRQLLWLLPLQPFNGCQAHTPGSCCSCYLCNHLNGW